LLAPNLPAKVSFYKQSPCPCSPLGWFSLAHSSTPRSHTRGQPFQLFEFQSLFKRALLVPQTRPFLKVRMRRLCRPSSVSSHLLPPPFHPESPHGSQYTSAEVDRDEAGPRPPSAQTLSSTIFPPIGSHCVFGVNGICSWAAPPLVFRCQPFRLPFRWDVLPFLSLFQAARHCHDVECQRRPEYRACNLFFVGTPPSSLVSCERDRETRVGGSRTRFNCAVGGISLFRDLSASFFSGFFFKFLAGPFTLTSAQLPTTFFQGTLSSREWFLRENVFRRLKAFDALRR